MEHARSLPDRYIGSRWLPGVSAVVLICLFSLWLTDALLDAEELAEKSLVESTIRNMRIGLMMAQAERTLRGERPDPVTWRGRNPVDGLESPPAGYAGACVDQGIEGEVPGSWCFDTTKGELVYRVRHHRYLKMENTAPGVKAPRLRWRIAIEQEMATNTQYSGVRVQLLTPYHWQLE